MSRQALNHESQSQHDFDVSLYSLETLDMFQKCVSTVEKSWSRLRIWEILKWDLHDIFVLSKPGGLDLSWHALDWESRS